MTDDFCWSCGNHGCGLCDPKNHHIAWLYKGNDKELPSVALDHELDEEQKKNCVPLVPQRTWVGLTNDEVNDFAAGCHLGNSVQGAIYKAEAKLKEKNT